jgi:hypothetical protein
LRRFKQAILKRMAERRDEYDFIHPGRLWKGWLRESSAEAEERTAQTIVEIMDDI